MWFARPLLVCVYMYEKSELKSILCSQPANTLEESGGARISAGWNLPARRCIPGGPGGRRRRCQCSASAGPLTRALVSPGTLRVSYSGAMVWR
jgi:hypothetical protein